jgi:DnaJ family protein C protein 13
MALLDSEQNGPEVIWNTEMRKRLLDHLTTELESYVKFRATNPLALYIHVPRTPLAYPELAGRVQGLGFRAQLHHFQLHFLIGRFLGDLCVEGFTSGLMPT